MQIYASLLRERRVALIWVGETLNAFGSGLTLWALAWLLLRTYPAQPLLAALVLSVLSLASLLGTVVLGAWLDVWDRRRTLILCNLALALLTGLIPWVAHAIRGPLKGALPLLALIAALGVLRSLPAPALSATLPSLVSPERLTALQAGLDTRLQLKLHVFGHIHEGYGVVEAGELTSVNASVLDAEYRLRNAPVVVDL
ncbi:MFS transporter [Deinococcus sp. UYEF24]